MVLSNKPFYFAHAVVASDSIGLVRSRPSLANCTHLLMHRFLLQKHVKPRLGNSNVHLCISKEVQAYIVSCCTHIERLYACAQIHCSCLLTIEFGLNILGNPMTLLTYLFVLKIDCSMFKVTIAITSFKNIVACCRSISNPV